MTQKSELTPKTDSGVSLIEKLVFEKLQNEALARGLNWDMMCSIGVNPNGADECDDIYNLHARNRRIVFTEDSSRIKNEHYCIELDRWFKENWNQGHPSEEEVASDLVRYIVMELDGLRAKRAESNIGPGVETEERIVMKEERAIPDFFVEMFQEHGVSAIRREAPAIPKEWVEEYAKTDDFRYLCETAAQCCRSFCDFLHSKLDSKEEK